MSLFKDDFTKKEVIEFLVANNNIIIKQIDPSKYFVIEKEEVVCYQRNIFFKDSEKSRQSFDEVLLELSTTAVF